MGDEGVSAVADAGPLVHLAEINSLSLLRIFTILHIPAAVWKEATDQHRIPGIEISRIGQVQRHTLPKRELAKFIAKHNLTELHAGERECLYLCEKIQIPMILTDDLAVRETAKRLGFKAVGSLGIIVRSYHLGRITLEEAERRILALQDVSSLFVTRAIVELAIEQLGD